MHKSDHKKITDFSINCFADSFNPGFQSVLKKENKKGYLLSFGSVIEDEFIYTPNRLHNWHFYRPFRSQWLRPFCSLIGKIHPSSRKTFKKYIKVLDEADKKNVDELLTVAGRIIHHIQDMSTPAHVIPIYHGPSLHPIHFPAKDDAFEKFSKDNILHYLSEDELSNIIELNQTRIFTESDHTLISLYDNVANRTLAYLSSDKSNFAAKVNHTEDKVQLSSKLFWSKFNPENSHNNKTDGWGHYGEFGKLFGQNFKREYQGKMYHVKLINYEHIYKHLIQQMIIDTFTVFKYLEKYF